MLASVTGPQEALLALAGGADVIDLKDPRRGALGALDLDRVRDSVAAIGARRPVSAVTGDGPVAPHEARQQAEALADAGVDIVKQGFHEDGRAAARVEALAGLAGRVELVAVLFADRHPAFADIVPRLAAAGFAGAMLDTADKSAGRLLTHLDLGALDAFVRACHAHRMNAGLAGSLEAPDVPRLLLLGPDVLGFRGALCREADRTGRIDPAALAAIRALIPAEESGPILPSANLRLLAARGYAPASREAAAADRVFVRDLVLPVQVGAYAFERGTPQRVRFAVEAAVTRPARPTENMADVFSYDVITDGIRLLIAEGHVALLETLAERIAALLLAHRAVLKVWVRLEKLDVGEGVVGCALERAREGAAP
jgi:dihydroneopterin aldolase